MHVFARAVRRSEQNRQSKFELGMPILISVLISVILDEYRSDLTEYGNTRAATVRINQMDSDDKAINTCQVNQFQAEKPENGNDLEFVIQYNIWSNIRILLTFQSV